MEKCQKGSSSFACNALDSVDFPELDAPLTKMIFPDKYSPHSPTRRITTASSRPGAVSRIVTGPGVSVA